MDYNKVTRDVLRDMKINQSITFKLGSYNACLSARVTTYYVKKIEGNTEYVTEVDAVTNTIKITKLKKQ